MSKIYQIEFNDDDGTYKFVPFKSNPEKLSDPENLITIKDCFKTLERAIEEADHEDRSADSGTWQSSELFDLIKRAKISLEFLKQVLNYK